jgi:Putative transposase of IS4/5 family (DUF4096)
MAGPASPDGQGLRVPGADVRDVHHHRALRPDDPPDLASMTSHTPLREPNRTCPAAVTLVGHGGTRTCIRRSGGGDRAASPRGAGQAERRPTAMQRPRCASGHRVRSEIRVPWEMLPREAFGCSGMTCWRRVRDWQRAGVWDHLHRVLLERLHQAGDLDWSRASIDSASIGAKRGVPQRGQARRTGASRGRSAMWSPIGGVRRSA